MSPRRTNAAAVEPKQPIAVDLTEVESASLRRSVRRGFARLGYRLVEYEGFWNKAGEGHCDELPRNLIVITVLSRLAQRFHDVPADVWLSFVRERQGALLAIVQKASDQKYAHLVDDLCRATEGRLWAIDWKQSSATGSLTDLMEWLDPDAVSEVKYSELDKTLWIEFADGLRRSLAWTSLRLSDINPPLKPSTIRVGDHPNTIAISRTDGSVLEIDAAVIRGLADPRRKTQLYAISEAAALSLGERLKRFRERREVSQSELAQRSGLTQEMISNLEHGKHQPRFGTLEKYAKGLGVSVQELLQ